jgi:ABC-type glycerol-3-phosphate transport system substrate-binding protein
VDYSPNEYPVLNNELDWNEFALAVLSRDKAYDIYAVPSWLHFAYNIREKGSFYPLNNVPGVREFLDSCFPHVKDAATDKDGNIWMIPVMLNIDAIMYHDENSKKAGIDFSNTATLDDVLENLSKAKAYDPDEIHFRLSRFHLIRSSTFKYLRDNTTLNTPEFRRLAEVQKDFWGEKDSFGNYASPFQNPSWDYINDGMEGQFNSNVLFDYYYHTISSDFVNQYNLSIAPLTGLDGAPYSAQSLFLCVNPDSSNLEAVLEYISAICTYLLNQKDVGIFADLSKYSDYAFMRQLYVLYENSVIDFNISEEVFANDFDRYLQDEITLDQFITEADRKLRMYLNE